MKKDKFFIDGAHIFSSFPISFFLSQVHEKAIKKLTAKGVLKETTTTNIK